MTVVKESGNGICFYVCMYCLIRPHNVPRQARVFYIGRVQLNGFSRPSMIPL